MYKSAHQFQPVYDQLGINLSKLGCVMLDLDVPQLSLLPPMYGDSLYVSENPERFWIDGDVSGSMHVTLLYGLLDEAKAYEDYIAEVLKGWELETVRIVGIGYFESPYPDEQYYCIVAHVDVTPQLLEGHERLECLPHVKTFPGYKAHATLCYIKKDEALRDKLVEELNRQWSGQDFKVKSELNLGGNKKS